MKRPQLDLQPWFIALCLTLFTMFETAWMVLVITDSLQSAGDAAVFTWVALLIIAHQTRRRNESFDRSILATSAITAALFLVVDAILYATMFLWK